MRHVLVLVIMIACAASTHAAEAPTDNPMARYYEKTPEASPAWIDDLPWDRVVKINDFPGDNDSRLAKAQEALDGKGGVVFFPAGTYAF